MKAAVFVISLTMLATAARADTAFISDKLVVSVYAEANQESDKLDSLESGAAVEILEKGEGFTRVKLADGREGWIKSTYLSAQPPAAVRVKELEKERAAAGKATEELKRLQEQNSALRSELESLRNAPPAVAAQPVAVRDESSSARSEEPSFSFRALAWGAAIAVLGGLVGFALGYRMLANRIKRKYGSLKIY